MDSKQRQLLGTPQKIIYPNCEAWFIKVIAGKEHTGLRGPGLRGQFI
uniref:Uncharacterized protein n=1 Tax=Candidatus Kentrum sp. FM TaxID=2126340 RepID=A0A450W8U1_9GAMM|nr:MAG: hypothetical protein BECKFM1743C_GA0114222_102845 [Candidatus Kentron sp. FM]VFJ61393.1 MAG: hypothetical protein BECKFM1743A_GA0114220_102835 [Candidatus Kentron sp. FM]VFK13460.1 MAG: hypothetical protein BECKFM1743B_GA0114221_102815 [Candidatus Kentron sp. FM]